MGWTLSKEFRFEASHQLADHDGKCARLHGHSWLLTVGVSGDQLHASGPKRGMLIDYADLKRVVGPLVENYLDHHHLNDTMESDSPTSERVAKWVYRYLRDEFPPTVKLAFVKVNETCTSACVYSEAEK